MDRDTLNEDLLALTHAGEYPAAYMGAVTPPVFLNSLHLFKTFEDYATFDAKLDEGYVYGRVSNPTVKILEEKLAALENGKKAAAFASGMAAASAAILSICDVGSHIVCLRDCYGPVKNFLNNFVSPKFGIEVTYIQGNNPQEFENAIKPNTKLFILESPATFVFSVQDLELVSKIAKSKGIKTYIDNSYCTPIFQKPLNFGIDIVMHTMSKYIGGHSDIIGGILVTKDEALMEKIIFEAREWIGGIIGPMEAWLAIRGLRTLQARLVQHQTTALQVAHFLESHPKVGDVAYTGLASHPQASLIAKQQSGHSGLLSFYLNSSPSEISSFINRLKLFGIGCSWGGFESLAIAPLYSSTDENLKFLNLPNGRNLIRIHCGLEGTENLVSDLEQSLHFV